MASFALGRFRSAAILVALAVAGPAGPTPIHAQQPGTPAMQQAVAALTRALREKDFAALAPYLDERFHVGQIDGAFARQVIQQAVAAGNAPTAVRVERVEREGGLIRATTQLDYPDTTRTLTLTLTDAGKFTEIPLVQVRMTGSGEVPPGVAVGGMRVRMGSTPPVSASPVAGARQPSAPALREELLAIGRKDQEVRGSIPRGADGRMTVSPELSRLMAATDSAHMARLREIIAQHGWPGTSLVGADGSQAAFLVLQHADQATQEHFLPMVRAAAELGEIARGLLATLEDRVRMRRGEKQLYGTQLRGSSTTGKLGVWPIEDEAHVDERRAAVGLPPLSQYLAAFGVQWSAPR